MIGEATATAVFQALAEIAWMRHAACVETDVDFFRESAKRVRAAKAICVGCPVRGECLDYALEHEIAFGIWGGTVPRERR